MIFSSISLDIANSSPTYVATTPDSSISPSIITSSIPDSSAVSESSTTTSAAPVQNTVFLTVSIFNAVNNKRQLSGNYIGPEGQLVGSCALAQPFGLNNGQLSSGGSFISTSPNYPAIQEFAPQTPTGILTTFSVVNNLLQWNVDSVPARSALFCVFEDTLLVFFDGNLPNNCTRVIISTIVPTCPGEVTSTVPVTETVLPTVPFGQFSTVSATGIALPSVAPGQAIGVLVTVSISININLDLDINGGTAVTVTNSQSSCALYATATSTQPCYVCQLAAQGQSCPASGVTVTQTICGNCAPETTFPAIIQTCPTCVAQTLTATAAAISAAGAINVAGAAGNSTGSGVACNGDSCPLISNVGGKSKIAASIVFVATIILAIMAV